MEEIKLEDLTENLNDYTITILAKMSMLFPISENWRKISVMLSDKNRILIRNKRSEIEREEIESKRNSMSEEEKKEQALKRKTMLEKLEDNPNTFFGNMGQPETPQDFKNRYGVWPPGHDKDGNKIKD